MRKIDLEALAGVTGGNGGSALGNLAMRELRPGGMLNPSICVPPFNHPASPWRRQMPPANPLGPAPGQLDLPRRNDIA